MLATLCVTEITSWGVLYYAFTVLSAQICVDTGWSAPAVTAAFSAALVTSALAGIVVGRWLDRYGPRWIMTIGSVLGVLAVLAVVAAPNYPCFVAAWVFAGFAMSAVFYAPAFAAVTRFFAHDAVRALTALTLVAGFASTVFAPLTAVLSDHLSWRETYLALAAVLAVVTVPAHLLGLRRAWPPLSVPHALEAPTRAVRSRPFVALTVSFALAALASYAVVVNLVPLMSQRGISTSAAAVALGLGGAGQVRGIMTLLQATAVTERRGPTHYGRLSGWLSAPIMISTALGPFVGAALATMLHGYATMFLALGAIATLAAACAAATSTDREPIIGHIMTGER